MNVFQSWNCVVCVVPVTSTVLLYCSWEGTEPQSLLKHSGAKWYAKWKCRTHRHSRWYREDFFSSGEKPLITLSRASDFLPHSAFILLWQPQTFTVIGVKDNSLSLTLGWCWKIICLIQCRCAEWISILFSLSSQPWKATFKMAAFPNRLHTRAFFSRSWGSKGIITHQYLFVLAVTISSSPLPPSLFNPYPKITSRLVVHSHLRMRLLSNSDCLWAKLLSLNWLLQSSRLPNMASSNTSAKRRRLGVNAVWCWLCIIYNMPW